MPALTWVLKPQSTGGVGDRGPEDQGCAEDSPVPARAGGPAERDRTPVPSGDSWVAMVLGGAQPEEAQLEGAGAGVSREELVRRHFRS